MFHEFTHEINYEVYYFIIKKGKIQRPGCDCVHTHIAFLKRHTRKHWLPLDFGNKRRGVWRESFIFFMTMS